MPHWMLKAIFQGGVSLLPKSQTLNCLFQKYTTKSLVLESGLFEDKLMLCRKHMSNHLAVSPTPNTQFSVIELGTGWYPIIPIGLYLCGASKIWTIDKVSLLSCSNVKEVLRFFIRYAQNGDLIKILPWARKDRITELRNTLEDKGRSSFVQILEKLNICALICDAREIKLEASSIDLFVSNTTFEHIPKDVLLSILVEFRRLASASSVMSHFIDMKDHYAYFDRSITIFNFMRYPSYIWRVFNNSLQYQNRLRISDYRKIHKLAGFNILYENSVKGLLEDIDKVNIAREFQRYSREELLIITSFIVSICNDKAHGICNN